MFEAQLETIGLIPATGRDQIAKARWTMYVGTLFAENYLASVQLSVMDMPRAQVILNRQLFEYFIRNQWLLHHPGDAADLLDCLPKTVQGEVGRAGVFDKSVASAIDKQYEDWAKNSPLANSKVQEANIKQMVEELSHGNFHREYFYLYSVPSLIAHARPHGIPDVLRITGPNEMERSPRSLWFERIDALNQSIGIMFQYASLLAGHFNCDMKSFAELNQKYGQLLNEFGQQPEVVGVKIRP